MLAIKAVDLGKKYEIYNRPVHRLAEMLSLSGKRYHRELWALKELYFEVPRGITLGIIGSNGAGKSTLLRLLCGVSQPTTGSITINGRITAVLQLGAGFRPDFTGRANLYMNCSLLGLQKADIDKKFDEIVDFAELWDFIDLPVKTYSSGMKMRLSFAIATTIDPDILLVDEVLAVGDEYFRAKCYNRINDFKARGKTLVIVSHSLFMVRNLCDRVMLLDKGRIVKQGQTDEVVDLYLKMVHEQQERRLKGINTRISAKKDHPRWGEGNIVIESIRLTDGNGSERHLFRTNERMVIEARYRVHRTVKKPVFGIGIFRSDGTYVSGINHLWHRSPIEIEELQGGKSGTVRCTIEDLPLLQGSYYISYYCYNHSEPVPVPEDHLERALLFQVAEGGIIEHGTVSIPTKWEID